MTTTALATMVSTAISTSTDYAADKHPALVYLASLAESSRRPMAQSLQVIAGILGMDDYLLVPWGAMRYNVSQAIRTQLAEKYSASTNRHLSALRGVLKEAWRLGYMSAEEYQRAVDLKAIKGQKVKQAEAGRHLSAGELGALNASHRTTCWSRYSYRWATAVSRPPNATSGCNKTYTVRPVMCWGCGCDLYRPQILLAYLTYHVTLVYPFIVGIV